jgi:carboxyl-terminal processing protease
MKRLLKTGLVILLLVVFAAGAFGLGLAIGRADSEPATAQAALPGSDTVVPDALPKPEVADADSPADLDTFWQVWDIVHEKFIDREALDRTNLEYGAIEGLIEALGDEGHTVFLTPQELTRQKTDISGKFQGIGAYVGMRDGLPVIVAPFDGSPAEQAGIRAGDIIMEVDGEDVTSWSLGDIVEVIRGTAGTEVVLTVLRADEATSLEIAITRGEITVPAATWAILPGTQVALIRLSQFSANANDEITLAIKGAEDAGAEALVVDVRNNPGGLLDQAIRVTSQFLKDGNVLQQEDAQGNRKAYPVKGGGLATDIPMVVLINPGSASSSEIFAGAIQDHDRGPLVGETTFGTGTVLEPFTLDDGSGLMLGTSQWLTANGRLIRKQGIEPDVVVEMPMGTDLLSPGQVEDMTPDDLRGSEDAQLLKALELLGALPES